MAIFKKPILRALGQKTREMPSGLWTKCPTCGEVIHNFALSENLQVCPKCDHHFNLGSRERIESLVDPDSFEEHDCSMSSIDPLGFKGMTTYADRLQSYKQKTGLVDAVTTGSGKISSHQVGLGVMDFNFLAATMGSVVGEKITR
ncbi:MAG: acetyl-CoA carboxylase carboxyl transferase subunit beta, partial [Proteobacteria bacterium]|nr:acetyl-CoA carboxylase carboxyl transferase subunit beta [Pseudomonadota bacterium]